MLLRVAAFVFTLTVVMFGILLTISPSKASRVPLLGYIAHGGRSSIEQRIAAGVIVAIIIITMGGDSITSAVHFIMRLLNNAH